MSNDPVADDTIRMGVYACNHASQKRSSSDLRPLSADAADSNFTKTATLRIPSSETTTLSAECHYTLSAE
jgi:hypothetical protein